MAAGAEVRLVELRQLHPEWGAGKLRYRLEREGCEPLPSRAAVSRALVRLGLVSARRARQRRREYRRWERGRPVELWQLDIAGLQVTQMREEQIKTAGFLACQGMLHNDPRRRSLMISSWSNKIFTKRPYPWAGRSGIATTTSPGEP